MGVLNFLEGSYLKREDLYLLLFSFELMYPYLNREILLLKHSAKWRNSVFVLTRDLPSEMYLNDWAIFKNGKIWQVILILQYAPNWEITRKKNSKIYFVSFWFKTDSLCTCESIHEIDNWLFWRSSALDRSCLDDRKLIIIYMTRARAVRQDVIP